MRSVVDWIAMPASGVDCSIRRALADLTPRETEILGLVALSAEHRPHVVLMDVRMPVMDGDRGDT